MKLEGIMLFLFIAGILQAQQPNIVIVMAG